MELMSHVSNHKEEKFPSSSSSSPLSPSSLSQVCVNTPFFRALLKLVVENHLQKGGWDAGRSFPKSRVGIKQPAQLGTQ